MRAITWIVRICFTIVFIVNVRCALGYVISPDEFVSGFQLSGTEGIVATQGMGIAFLMWNATYPAFIIAPNRFKVLGFVILAQQLIGLIGESVIYSNLLHAASASSTSLLSQTILRFIEFDAFGLVIMAISFSLFLFITKRAIFARKTNL